MRQPERQDRFETPKACFQSSKNGAPTYGLPEKLSLRVQQHTFEAQKSGDNSASQDRMQVYPTGEHYQRCYNLYIESSGSGMLSDDSSASADAAASSKSSYGRRQEHVTSTTNPLCLGEANAASQEAQVGCGKATYSRDGSTPALSVNLDATLVPLRLTTSSSGASSDAGEAAAGSVGTSDGGDFTTELGEQRRLLAERNELTVRLMREYPHGIPKAILVRLRAEGLSHLPSLGFGCS